MGSLTLLNEMGDLTLAWDAKHDADVKKIIEKKMKEGIRFFIVKPFDEKNLSQIKSLKDVAGREVIVKDEDIELLFTNGKVGIFKRIQNTLISMIEPVTDKNISKAMKSDIVGIKPLQAG